MYVVSTFCFFVADQTQPSLGQILNDATYDVYKPRSHGPNAALAQHGVYYYNYYYYYYYYYY